MVLIDTSIWVDYFRGTASPLMSKMVNGLIDNHDAAIAPVIRLELLRGASPQEAEELQETFGGLHELAFESQHWQLADRLVIELRTKGVSPAIADVLIATSALDYHAPLFHRDRIFDAIARHTGLAIYPPKH